MKFQADFGAEDEARLTPCEDDKPKDTEITLFKAGSDYYLSAKAIIRIRTEINTYYLSLNRG